MELAHRQTQLLLKTSLIHIKCNDMCFDLFGHHHANILIYKNVKLYKYKISCLSLLEMTSRTLTVIFTVLMSLFLCCKSFT